MDEAVTGQRAHR